MTREEAVKVIMGVMNNYHIDSMVNRKIDEALSVAIQALKSEPKHGRWKKAYLDHESFGVRPTLYYCSECCSSMTVKMRYCPNCGARMDEG